MAITLTIGGTIIEFPSSAAAPNWAEGVIQFAQATEAALASVAGAFDVAPQIQIIDAYNPGVNVDMPSFSFPTSDVRAAQLIYSVYRTTTTETAYETGTLQIVYSPNNPSTQQWEVSRQYTGDGKISFYVTDAGQVQFTTEAMGGSSHTGTLTYTAKALLQT